MCMRQEKNKLLEKYLIMIGIFLILLGLFFVILKINKKNYKNIENTKVKIKVGAINKLNNNSELIVTNNGKKLMYAITLDNKMPGNVAFKNMNLDGNNYKASLEFLKNGTYYIWVKDSDGYVYQKKIVIDNIKEDTPQCEFSTLN